jgi:hypothetical protein
LPSSWTLLKLTSPEELALRLMRLVVQYVDFGMADVHLAGGKNVRYLTNPRFTLDEMRDGIDLVTPRGDVFWQE